MTQEMPFLDHLDELRARLIRCVWVFFIGFIVCYSVSETIMGVLSKPLFDVMPPDQQKLYFTSLFENFLTHLKISGYASLFLFSPFFLYQLWAFIAPGLYDTEKKMAFPFVAVATLFFLGGAGFAYFFVFPLGFKFFINYGSASDTPILTIDSYYGTVLKLLLVFGLAFEFPVIIGLLGMLGVVDAPFLRKHRGSFIIGITVCCALFAPPDAISMLMMMAPMLLLFEVAIGFVARFGKKNIDSRHQSSKESDLHSLEGRSRP